MSGRFQFVRKLFYTTEKGRKPFTFCGFHDMVTAEKERGMIEMFEIGILNKRLYNRRPCTICGICSRRYPEDTLEMMAMQEAGSSAHGFYWTW